MSDQFEPIPLSRFKKEKANENKGAAVVAGPSIIANDEVFEATEDGIALAFAAQYDGDLLYDHNRGTWFQWTGTHWKEDRTKLAFDYARIIARSFAAKAFKLSDKKRLSRIGVADAVERAARADRRFATLSGLWDPDVYLLGTPDGVVDLRTGALRPALPDDRITKLTACGPGKGDCPLWLSFLSDSTGGDTEFIEFLQRWCGYCLTGDTSEHALVFVHGPGGNGKSVFLNVLTGIAGAYAVTAPMDTFTASTSDRHPTDLAALAGARIVTASETEEGRAWAEARVKSMTGGDPISARFMRQDFFTYLPQFKLTVIGNRKPTLSSTDEAIRRRFNVAPFDKKPSVVDHQLPDKLRAEWPAILTWMIEGCLKWQEGGLTKPQIVHAASDSYFDEQDIFGQWLAESCVCEPGNPYRSEKAAVLFKSWSDFAKQREVKVGTMMRFVERLQLAGLKKRKTKAANVYEGIELQVSTRSSNEPLEF